MSLVVQVASLLGILFIIVLSYDSLIHARRAAVRESLEQLDDIRFATHDDVKVKPVLYRCRGLVVRGRCEVKFKFYGAARPGASDPGVFLEFPDDIFGDHEVRRDDDGYIVAMASNNPVEIRRNANEILFAMYDHEAAGDRETTGPGTTSDDETTTRKSSLTPEDS